MVQGLLLRQGITGDARKAPSNQGTGYSKVFQVVHSVVVTEPYYII